MALLGLFRNMLIHVFSWVVGLALLADTVPQDQLAQATGWISLGMSLGILIAPLLGGIVFDHAGYNAVFGVAYALIGLDIVLRLLLVEKKVAARWLPNSPASSGTSASVESGSNEAASPDDDAKSGPAQDPEKARPTVESDPPPMNNTSIVQGFPHRRHGRRRDRLPPVLSLLYSRRLWAALVCSLPQAALMTSFDSVLTIHAANVF